MRGNGNDGNTGAHTIPVSAHLRLMVRDLGVAIIDERGEVFVPAGDIDLLIVRLFDALKRLRNEREEVDPWTMR